ncbi:MAG: hypothetical protein GF346_07030 [Candidatus Eisenbacteria bacterium]|nr:hypothetical protein [Candidatus Latescibacterota bacterium]MBD3302183.1 hypothetical protein [Candidatus Eisenbacteria bacterium]
MPFLQFVNGVFLAGLAAAALPILIHLFSRRRTRTVAFPSLEFLEEVSRKKVRRIQLRQFLLLLLRVLIIALFALAIARPTVQSGMGGIGRGNSTVAIVLDNSFSMAARDPARSDLPPPVGTGGSGSPVPEEGTVYETAKLRALEILSMMRDGDRAVLALAAEPVRLPYESPITDLGLLRREIEQAPLSARPADLARAVERSARLLAEGRTPNRELYIVSDFQRIDIETWRAARAGVEDTLSGPAAALPEEVRVYLVPARVLPVENLAIERVRLDLAASEAETGARLFATVANHSEQEAREVVVRALPEGETGDALGEAYVTVPPGGRADATLLLRRLPESGRLSVRLTPDPLSWDNVGYLVTEQPGLRRILVVSGASDPATDPGVRFVRLALDPSGTQEFFQIETVSADDPGLADRLDADAVLLLDVPRLPASVVDRLERYRAEGGGLLVVLGQRTDPRTYNTTIFPRLAEIELLGMRGDPDQEDLYRSLRVSATGHPIFDGFPAGAGATLTSARFQRVLEARAGDGTRVLAEYSGGLPALIEDRNVLVMASSFDGEWNDLPTSGAFVPLLHRMLVYLITEGSGADRRRVGTTLEETVDPALLESRTAFFVDPQGARIPAERSERDGKVRLQSPPTTLPGTYRLVREDGRRLGLYAVNLDPRESDLRPAPESWLPALFDPPAVLLRPEGELNRELIEARYGRELWSLLLLIVLGLMVAESLIGRGKLLP